MNSLKQHIRKVAESLKPRVVRIRREIHRNPELSFREHATSALICRELEDAGIPHSAGIAGTGVVAHIQGTMPGPTILLRADMDALPIHEQTDLPYASNNAGIMHACGHDLHTASLLGTALILQDLRNKFAGTIRLVFQPAEEKLPGGASFMIREGVLNSNEYGPAPSCCIAQHVHPSHKAGTLGFRSGTFMASADELYIDITAKGGHAATPNLLDGDVVLATSHVIIALQSIVSRNSPADIPSVLSIGRVEAEGSTNVIPSSVQLQGTFRTMNESWRKIAHQRIKQVATNTASAHGAHANIEIRKGFPTLVNDARITRMALDIATAYVGESSVMALPIWMAGEDFAYFSQQCSSLLYILGVGPSSNLHSPDFNPDESALTVGIGFMAFFVLKLLKNCNRSEIFL
ncbi:MAG: M20 family metallopeptidase [Bacteroidetes bacterium]|nr:M20 family metallopeptidase [Bacteroidota bacterium]MCY4205592.1 M20 family metallopeptidase [Bacteroidota bacterium]